MVAGQKGSYKQLADLCREGRLDDALHTLTSLRKQGVCVSTLLYALLQNCVLDKTLSLGKNIHSLIEQSGYGTDNFLGTHLIRMFSSCGCLSEAVKVFRNLPKPNQHAWSAVILAHVKHGDCQYALKLYQQLREAGVSPDRHVYVTALQCCDSSAASSYGKIIHADIIESSTEPNGHVGGALIHMYIRCGSLMEACSIFEPLLEVDVVTWSCMIAGFVDHGQIDEALWIFDQMQEQGTQPNQVTFINVLKAFSNFSALPHGRIVHTMVVEQGCDSDIVVNNALISMYCSCGGLVDGRHIFDKLQKRDLVTWGSLLDGYASYGLAQETLQLLHRLHKEGVEPNAIVYSIILKYCAKMASLKQGKLAHTLITCACFEYDEVVQNTLVDMYSKCGSIEDARAVLEKMRKPSVMAWNALIRGHVWQKEVNVGKQVLNKMRSEGLNPDSVTLLCLLSACNHSGLFHGEGSEGFKWLEQICDGESKQQHQNCMVDLLGRAGFLNQAEDMLQTLPIEPNSVGWLSLLTNCNASGEVNLAGRCFQNLVSLDCRYAAGFTLMSKMYAEAHMWERVMEVQILKTQAQAWKQPGKAWSHIGNDIQEFTVGEDHHPHSEEINAKLIVLSALTRKDGHVPMLNTVTSYTYIR